MEALQFIQTTPEALVELINKGVKIQLEDFRKNFGIQNADELLTRTEACKFLKIEQTTLYHWTKKSKITAYGIANRRYYKKSELIECLIKLEK